MINISESNHKTFLKRREVQVLLMEDILHQLLGSFAPWFTRFCTWCRISSINCICWRWSDKTLAILPRYVPKEPCMYRSPAISEIQFLSSEQVWEWNIHHFESVFFISSDSPGCFASRNVSGKFSGERVQHVQLIIDAPQCDRTLDIRDRLKMTTKTLQQLCYTNCWVDSVNRYHGSEPKIISCLRQNHRKKYNPFWLTCHYFPLKWWSYMAVSLNGGAPKTPPKWSFLVGKPMGLLGKPTILGNTLILPGTFGASHRVFLGETRSHVLIATMRPALRECFVWWTMGVASKFHCTVYIHTIYYICLYLNSSQYTSYIFTIST